MTPDQVLAGLFLGLGALWVFIGVAGILATYWSGEIDRITVGDVFVSLLFGPLIGLVAFCSLCEKVCGLTLWRRK